MDTWDTETTAERERVPVWLVEFSQIWAAQSATQYQQEYKEVRNLARVANVPPFVIMVRMFRDTYQITHETTKEQFRQAADKQMAADGGQMFLHLAAIPTGEAERAQYARELEEKTAQAAVQMKEAMDANDDQRFQVASEIWGQAQETWLIVTQSMTLEKARAVMVGFAAAGKLNKWMDEAIPGPPPCVFDLYKKL